jgi:hypothetical protein
MPQRRREKIRDIPALILWGMNDLAFRQEELDRLCAKAGPEGGASERGGRRPRMGDYVTGMGATRGAPAAGGC